MKNRYLPAILWTLLLIWASSNHSSAQNTGGILAWIIQFSGLPLQETSITTLNFILRKSMHVCGYGMLTLLWARAFKNKNFVDGRALIICFGVASWDEWHQSLLEQRTGSSVDVCLDLLGGLLFLLFWHLIRQRQASKNSALPPL